MKASKEWLQNQALYPLFSWKVPSNSVKGKYYTVGYYEGNQWICNCFAGEMKKECRHIRRVKNQFKGKYEKETY